MKRTSSRDKNKFSTIFSAYFEGLREHSTGVVEPQQHFVQLGAIFRLAAFIVQVRCTGRHYKARAQSLLLVVHQNEPRATLVQLQHQLLDRLILLSLGLAPRSPLTNHIDLIPPNPFLS